MTQGKLDQFYMMKYERSELLKKQTCGTLRLANLQTKREPLLERL